MDYSNINIRLATDADLTTITNCAQKAYAHYVQRMNKKPAPMVADFVSLIKKKHVHIAVLDGQFLGYVVFFKQGDTIQLENVAVEPAITRNGIGKQLINFVEDAARNAGIARVELYTNEMMTENLLLYPKLGYIEIDRRNEAGFNRVYFLKRLS